MDGQALVWFGIAGGAALFAISLLHARYVARQPRAVHSRGGFTLFAFIMLLFAVGAFIAGLVATGGGS